MPRSAVLCELSETSEKMSSQSAEQVVTDYKSFYCNVPEEQSAWVDAADIEVRALGAPRNTPGPVSRGNTHPASSLRVESLNEVNEYSGSRSLERCCAVVLCPLLFAQGKIPEELMGTLLRNGPGLCEVLFPAPLHPLPYLAPSEGSKREPPPELNSIGMPRFATPALQLAFTVLPPLVRRSATDCPLRAAQVGGVKMHPIDGDGMISRFSFQDGRVHFSNSIVRTEGCSPPPLLFRFPSASFRRFLPLRASFRTSSYPKIIPLRRSASHHHLSPHESLC